MTILTAPNIKDSNNLRICDNNGSNPNCINFNLTNGNFNITPETSSTKSITMNNIDGSTLAFFDMQNNIIKIAPTNDSNDDAALYIKNKEVYMKSLKLLNNPNGNYTTEINSNNYTDINSLSFNNIASTAFCYYFINYIIDNNNNKKIGMDINIIPMVDIDVKLNLYINIPEITSDSTPITLNQNSYIKSGEFTIYKSISYIKFKLNSSITAKQNFVITITGGILCPTLSDTGIGSMTIGYIDS